MWCLGFLRPEIEHIGTLESLTTGPPGSLPGVFVNKQGLVALLRGIFRIRESNVSLA